MKLLPLEKLGAREVSPGVVEFGMPLPWVSAKNGYKMWVRVIHEKDQFLQEIKPCDFEMSYSYDQELGDYWSCKVNIYNTSGIHPKSSWGTTGKYVYRYMLRDSQTHEMIDWIVCPFAREFSTGKMSAITLSYEPHTWSENEKNWRVPAINDLIMYELMLGEFGGGIDGTIEKLDYLKDLGVNCLELMPVSNVLSTIDWGYLPVGYFGVDERFGKRRDMQRLVDAAHQRGIAVILDSVYGHTSDIFTYSYVYKKLKFSENPFMGSFSKDYFGESTDYNREFTRNFFFTVNNHWLDCYHVDGFRYDCVPNFWDGPTGNGYANLTYSTYQLVKSNADSDSHWKRFKNGDYINLIQCAEQLEGPEEIIEKTYSNCTWQNETLGAAKAVANGNFDHITSLGYRFGLLSYPEETNINNDRLIKTALQYIENHDHKRFICNFKMIIKDNELLGEGSRDVWYKIQPYLMGLFTSKGIPLLWQGEEFGENYYVPDSGWGRVMLYRPVRWDYFYDDTGKEIIGLVRKLAAIRAKNSQFRKGKHYFYNHYDNYQSKGVLMFSREYENKFSLIALNFGDSDQTIPFSFPYNGTYKEELYGDTDDTLNLKNVISGADWNLVIPSNFGRIWTVNF